MDTDSGILGSIHWITDPDPSLFGSGFQDATKNKFSVLSFVPDPSLFGSGFQDATKNKFSVLSFVPYFFL